MRVFLAERRRRINVNDLWVASVALAHGLPIVTQDNDFTALEEFPGLSIIKV
jgi:predicted nucleic acid-binding protein